MNIRVFIVVKKKNKFLLIRESSLRWKNKWYFPGGLVEDKENLVQAAIRETREESGYEVAINGICFIKYINLPVPEKGLYVYCSGRILNGSVKTDHDEHSMESGWFDLKQIESLETRGNLPDLISKFRGNLPLISSEQMEL